MSLWDEVKEFFDEEDGVIPDIFVDQLSQRDVETVYAWIRSVSTICGEPTLWSIKENRAIPIAVIENPARDFNAGEVETFHHTFDIEVNGTAIPTLGVFVEDRALAFDYCTGKEWGAQQVIALFEFLSLIKDKCPPVRIYEGHRDRPSMQFVRAFERYYADRAGSRR
jgi:hypothetical protein